MFPIEPTDLPEPPAWLAIEHRIAELLDGEQPTPRSAASDAEITRQRESQLEFVNG